MGGRVLTHHFCDAPELNCELGGEWIGHDHTTDAGPVQRVEARPAETPYANSFWNQLTPANLIPPGQWCMSAEALAIWEKFQTDFMKLWPQTPQGIGFDRLVDPTQTTRFSTGRLAPPRHDGQHRLRRNHPHELRLHRRHRIPEQQDQNRSTTPTKWISRFEEGTLASSQLWPKKSEVRTFEPNKSSSASEKLTAHPRATSKAPALPSSPTTASAPSRHTA